MTRVMVTCPSVRLTGDTTFNSLRDTAAALRAEGFEVVEPAPYILRGCSEIGLARSAILRRFLDSQAHILMSFDDDESWPASDAVALAQTSESSGDRGFLSGVYPIKRFDTRRIRSAGDLDGIELSEHISERAALTVLPGGARFDHAGHKFAECSAVGAGAMCLTRAAILRMIEVYPELRGTGETSTGAFQEIPFLFIPMIYRGAYMTEDVAFCQRYRDAGMRIYAMTTSRFVHWGMHPYRIALDKRLE
jgi:hypothetical protein